MSSDIAEGILPMRNKHNEASEESSREVMVFVVFKQPQALNLSCHSKMITNKEAAVEGDRK